MAFAAVNSVGGSIGTIEDAFATEPSLKKRVYDAIGAYGQLCIYTFMIKGDSVSHSLTVHQFDYLGSTPQHTPLFEDIARYTCSLQARAASTTSLPLAPPPPSEGPAAKKRKIQNGELGPVSQALIDVKDNSVPIQFYIQDVSFAIPQRKKLTLEVTAGNRYLRARNQTTKQVEFGVSLDHIRELLQKPELS